MLVHRTRLSSSDFGFGKPLSGPKNGDVQSLTVKVQALPVYSDGPARGQIFGSVLGVTLSFTNSANDPPRKSKYFGRFRS